MWFTNWIHLLRLLTLEAKIWFLISILLALIKKKKQMFKEKKSVKGSQLQWQQALCLCVGDSWVTDEETLRLWEVKANTSRKYHSSDSELYLLSYRFVCMCVYACLHVCGACVSTCVHSLWRPEDATGCLPWSLSPHSLRQDLSVQPRAQRHI